MSNVTAAPTAKDMSDQKSCICGQPMIDGPTDNLGCPHTFYALPPSTDYATGKATRYTHKRRFWKPWTSRLVPVEDHDG